MKEETPKIGYVPIEAYKTDKPKVCEAPRHVRLELPAHAVVAVSDGDYEVVEMVCFECWAHFDRDMGSPNWNMLEWEEEKGGER